jgi:secernin
MGSDMVVAVARATAEGRTLFGHNSNRPAREGYALARIEGRAFALGETVSTGRAVVPQVRRTNTVLAGRQAGRWGYCHGVNEHGVAAGITAIATRLSGTGLSGPDLVRLGLERASSARQALDVITDLVARHGQQADDTPGADSSFLVADGSEAFAVETSGQFWAEQAIGRCRAASDICHLRQDWNRICPGLADCAIKQGWWLADGSKLDFARSVGVEGQDNAASLRRWARATLLLEQHSGQLDVPCLRGLLRDHSTGKHCICRHAGGPDEVGTSASLVVSAGLAGSLPVAWCAFGPPCLTVYLPLLLPGDLPTALQGEEDTGACPLWRRMIRLAGETQRDATSLAATTEALGGLQEHLDHEVREFLAEAAVLQQRGEVSQLHRLAGSLMEHAVERWEAVVDELLPAGWRAPAPHGRAFEFAGAWD